MKSNFFFKKIEIWILYLCIIFSFITAVFFGFLVRQELIGTTKLGYLSKSALQLSEVPKNIAIILNLDLKLNDRFEGLSGFNGNHLDKEAYLLLSRYDNNIKSSVVELVDLRSFEILHKWDPDIDSQNRLYKKLSTSEDLYNNHNDKRFRLFHPLLLKNGSIIFQNASPLRKISKNGDLECQNYNQIFHHSAEIDLYGNIWVPSYLYPTNLPKYFGSDRSSYSDDAITKVSQDCDIIFQKSVSEIFIENNLEYLLFSVGDRIFTKDPIHLNDIQPVLEDGDFWKKGDLFLSLRRQSMIMLYRPSTNEVLWHKTGPFYHQHDVDILDSTRISIFNNNSKYLYSGDVVDGNNEILIYDFKDDSISSYLDKSMKENDIRTITEGQSEIIFDGDLFIEESNFGRSLYFNKEGNLKWFHINRASNGNVYMINWSRILYKEDDIKNVNDFLNTREI